MAVDMKFEDGTLLRLRSPEPGGIPAISLMPGLGAHRLAVRVEIERLNVAEGINQAMLSGELRATDGRGWVGSFLPAPVPLRTKANVRTVDLIIPVTSEQVLALEQHRNGQDLAVTLDVEGALPQTGGYPFAHAQEQRRIPASVWENQIEQLGLAVSFTITVPLPLTGGPLAAAAGHLRTADRQITAGEYPDAIRETRLAVDAMRKLNIWPQNGAKKRDDQDQGDRYGVLLDRLADQADGYGELLRALFNQASGPQHNDGPIGSAAWVRDDAITLNGMAASLLHRLAEEVRTGRQ
ncbi:hypothetical protein [Streptomyces sp. TLI_146]|uniref:hypothetical protein n=1 Tax=Streptomyces sp. TLI_146 TaxID=1938858 RepID=UPI000C707C3F|nr:hypothetical protein [Streptomyces sp. TLI_146]PKV88198.1 hypothetical protein BX283_5809 [Streptomyces sp. TLI_146]